MNFIASFKFVKKSIPDCVINWNLELKKNGIFNFIPDLSFLIVSVYLSKPQGFLCELQYFYVPQ